MASPTRTIPFTALNDPPGFPTAMDALESYLFAGEEPRTLLELRICTVAGEIRDRRDCWMKVCNTNIVPSWLEDLGCPESPKSPEDDAVFSNALSEVRWQASAYPGPARPAAAYGTFSVEKLPTDLVSRLLAGAEKIRASSRRDERPGSNGLVVDLVHPSMYAYEQGVTAVLGDANVNKAPAWDSFIGTGISRPEEKPDDDQLESPAGLAWLPSEFSVSDCGDQCTINSYINSLHPREHDEMYGAISQAFLVAVPLFEDVLNFIGSGREPWQMPLRIDNTCRWVSEGEEGHVEYPPYEHPFQHDVSFSRRRYEGKTLILPAVPSTFTPPTLPARVISLKGKDLQVIVKLTSIELKPEQPYYDGTFWHVDGIRNERIVATTCMYLEVENVVESRTEFRTAVCEPFNYELGDVIGVKHLLGLLEGGPLVQRRGTSRTLPGRALAWPNTLQHRMSTCRLHDRTRPGRLTILSFFLVDPTLRVRSSATVPPQIKDWIAMECRAPMLDALPREVVEIIASHCDGMSFKDACERRLRIMFERHQLHPWSFDMLRNQNTRFERSFQIRIVY